MVPKQEGDTEPEAMLSRRQSWLIMNASAALLSRLVGDGVDTASLRSLCGDRHQIVVVLAFSRPLVQNGRRSGPAW